MNSQRMINEELERALFEEADLEEQGQRNPDEMSSGEIFDEIAMLEEKEQTQAIGSRITELYEALGRKPRVCVMLKNGHTAWHYRDRLPELREKGLL